MSLLNSISNVVRFNRKNWRAVVLCAVTATVFWFFNALNKTYTTSISFPLSFQYDTENFVPVEKLPQFVRLNVTGNGWDLFKRSAGVKMEPLEIPLERPSEIKKIVGSGLPPLFSNQVEGISINYVLHDTLYLDLEPKEGRWVKLAVDSVQGNLKSGFALVSHVAVIPDSTFVIGPRRVVNAIQEPVVLRVPDRNIDQHFVRDVPVQLERMISMEPQAVSIMFNVDEMIPVKDSIRLILVNLPPTVSEVMSTRKVPVTLRVPKAAMATLEIDSVKAVLDLKRFVKGTAKILPRVEGLPPYSTVEKIDSVIVKF